MTVEAAAIQTALRERTAVPDEVFDRQYPRMCRFRSSVHWTPVDVAIRVAELLQSAPGGQILDVGAGVGKACIIGALTTSNVWFGVERNPSMVRTARRAAQRFGVDHRTRFVVGEAMLIDWSPFGGIYLYNPFAEALFQDEQDPGRRREAYIDEVRTVEQKLASMRPDTLVATYHGFGGDFPDGFELVHTEKTREDEISLWIRRGSGGDAQ